MRTAIWLYLFMFVAFFDLHAQFPILSPFAISLGAAPTFIGLILGVYSITHLPGNLLAGYAVDRYGSKRFIIASLVLAGMLLIFQAKVKDPYQLLAVRSISGFVLAFLSPACMALLAKIARDRFHRGKLMAGNGLVHTMASVVSPAAGAYLVARLGFTSSFTVLGWGLIATGLLAAFGINEKRAIAEGNTEPDGLPGLMNGQAGYGRLLRQPQAAKSGIPWLFFGVPLAISCSQGILFFELPLINQAKQSILTSGILFSLVSLGALVTLSMLFLNRLSGLVRTVCGALSLALIFFGMAVGWSVPLYVSLFLIGMAKGVLFPAMSNLLASATSASRYGRAYSIMSIAASIGSFLGPTLAGHLHGDISPYFIAFFVLMLGLSFLPLDRLRTVQTT